MHYYWQISVCTKKKQHVWMIVYGLICTRKSYNMYKILLKKSWFVFYKKQYIVGEITWQKFTIHERHLRAQNGKIVDFNTESQNNRIYTPHMVLTKEPTLQYREESVAITSNPITTPSGKIRKCTSPIWVGKKQHEVISLETQNTTYPLNVCKA